MKKFILPALIIIVAFLLWILWDATQSSAKKDESEISPTGAFSAEGGDYVTWAEYDAPSGLFQALFPFTPKFNTTVERNDHGMPVRTTEVYSSETANGTVYLISVIRYHTEDRKLPLPNEEMVNNVLYEMVDSEPKNQLIGFDKKTFLGEKALQFTIINQDVQIDSLTFATGQDLFIINMMSTLDNYKEEDFQHFYQSFKIR